MKEVNIENVKDRIGHLNAASHIGGKLDEDRQFELSCLHELLAKLQRSTLFDYETAVQAFREMNIGFPVEKFKADFVIKWCMANVCKPGPSARENALTAQLASIIQDLELPDNCSFIDILNEIQRLRSMQY